MNWESGIDICARPWVKQKASGEPLSSALCDDLEGWNAGGGGRSKRKGVCIHIAESLHCTAEMNVTLQSNDIPIKEKNTDLCIPTCEWCTLDLRPLVLTRIYNLLRWHTQQIAK